MKRFKLTLSVTLLTLTLSSTSLAGTIVGGRTNRTGTIVGGRAGTIVGGRTGNIAGTRIGIPDRSVLTPQDGTDTKLNLTSVLSGNIDGILRLLLTRTLF